MLRKILKINGIQELNKKAQKNTQGGVQFLCEEACILGFRLCYIDKNTTFYQPC